jgi:hypothetical protein
LLPPQEEEAASSVASLPAKPPLLAGKVKRKRMRNSKDPEKVGYFWRAWVKQEKKMRMVLQWNHPAFHPAILTDGNEPGEVITYHYDQVVLLRNSWFRDAGNRAIFESDILLVTTEEGRMFFLPVVKRDGMIGVTFRGNFAPIPAITALIPTAKDCTIMGNTFDTIIPPPGEHSSIDKETIQ